MRLLRYSDADDLGFVPSDDEPIPTYAILSHTWGADTVEVTSEDLINGTGKDKPEYEKIRSKAELASICREQASTNGRHLFWVNALRIHQANRAERVASTLRWLQNSNQCYAWLSDLSTTERNVSGQSTEKPDFQGSQWFARKLLPAPHSVEYKRSREGFRLEVEALKKLSHRHVIQLIASYTHTRSVGLLLHPVAVCDLGTFFDNAEALSPQKVQNVEHLAAKFKPECMLEYLLPMVFGRNATIRDEVGANCGLDCQHIRINGLCTYQNDRAGSAKQPKLMAQYYPNAVYTPDRFSSSAEEGIAVQDPSRINMKDSPAINGQVPSKLHRHLTYSASHYVCQAPELPLPHRFHIAPTWGGIGSIPFVPGAEEQCVVESNVTCSTALSDKTSVFSKLSENGPAAGTEFSNHYNASTSTSQSWKEVPLLRKGRISPADAHESCEPELRNNGPVTPGFEDSHLSADGREDSGYGEQELSTLGKDIAHSEDAILANYETSALRDFVDDPGHQYWTWCKEHQNWWHKDEKTNAMIWAPLDFD